MASIYQLVPYLLQVHVRGKPSETRPVDNIDAKGTTLLDVLARSADALRGKTLLDPEDSNRKLRLTRVRTGDRMLFIEFEPGRAGLKSTIEGDTIFKRKEGDTEYTPLRYAIYFPSGSHAAILLAERAGQASCVTMASRFLISNFGTMLGDLILTVNAAVTGDVMNQMTRERPIKSLVFTRPVGRDVSAKLMHEAGVTVPMEIRFRAPRRRSWRWNELPADASGDITAESLLGILAPEIGETGDGAASRLLDQGWDVATEVKFANGATRTVNVTSHSSITMSFPIHDPDQNPDAGQPDDDEFRQACVRTYELFKDQYGIRGDVGIHVVWDDEEWTAPAGMSAWKVVWDESCIAPTAAT